MATSRIVVLLVVLPFASSVTAVRTVRANEQIAQTPLSGRSIAKYVEPLPTFVGARVPAGTGYTVAMEEFQQSVLPANFYAALPAPFNAGTYVWGYKTGTAPASYPGFTVEAQKGTPVTVTYVNDLSGPNGAPAVLQKYLTVDQTLNWADPLALQCVFFPTNPQCFTPYGYPNWPGTALANAMPPGAPVPAVTHLHGAEVQSFFDGGPEAWFTPNGLHGPAYGTSAPVLANQAEYVYGNSQEATTLWFHDHAFGSTRSNVYAGLAAFYLLRDDRDTGLAANPIGLPAGPEEIEMVIQDRIFDTNGQWFFPDGPGGLNGTPPNPAVHPFWIPEFFGDVIVVNGKSWPYLDVEPRRYRFRLLDGSNARMYNLALEVGSDPGPPIWQIGTDGGLLDSPVRIAWPNRLFLAPGERADVIVDFSDFVGRTLTLVNNAKAPFPSGAPADPQTVGRIMQFRVASKKVDDGTCSPAAETCNLRGSHPIVRLADPATGTWVSGVTPTRRRQLVLKEIEGAGGPLEVLLNNTEFDGIMESTATTDPTALPDSFPSSYSTGIPLGDADHRWLTEGPQVGSTEEWDIINVTADAHPIHIHLVQFQLLNRQRISSQYSRDWEAAFADGFKAADGPPFPYDDVNADGAIGGNVAVSPYLLGRPMPPRPNEAGWKDTAVMKPGEVTRIAVRWAPQDTALDGVAAGVNRYSFDPTAGPGYVWHCHILDHEDNEMMRPYAVTP